MNVRFYCFSLYLSASKRQLFMFFNVSSNKLMLAYYTLLILTRRGCCRGASEARVGPLNVTPRHRRQDFLLASTGHQRHLLKLEGGWALWIESNAVPQQFSLTARKKNTHTTLYNFIRLHCIPLPLLSCIEKYWSSPLTFTDEGFLTCCNVLKVCWVAWGADWWIRGKLVIRELHIMATSNKICFHYRYTRIAFLARNYFPSNLI